MVNSEFLRRYILRLVQSLGSQFNFGKKASSTAFSLIKKAKGGEEDILTFVHYLYSLAEFDQSMLALSQLNVVLSRKRQKNTFNFYEECLLSIMSQHIKAKMSVINFGSRKVNDSSVVIASVVESFIASEIKFQLAREEMRDVLKEKMKFLDGLLNEKFESAQSLYSKCSNLTTSINSLAQTVQVMYC